jgi:chemotaxis protein methyltransferase CheR
MHDGPGIRPDSTASFPPWQKLQLKVRQSRADDALGGCRIHGAETVGEFTVRYHAGDSKGIRVTPAPSLHPVRGPTGSPEPDLVRIRDLIYQVAGIFHPDSKLSLLQDRCGRRMKELKVQTLRQYFECLTIRPIRQAELIALLNEITIGETCFFRNQRQIDAFRRIVLPNILQAKSNSPQRRLRIWSAGCSTGEEPYTLRMVQLEEAEGALKNWTVEILATDLNEHSLAHAKEAIYRNRSTRNLTPLYREKYFIPIGDQLQVKPLVRADVSFSQLNLSDDARMALMNRMDAIFCCNVLIYFDLVSKRRVIQHFFDNLLPHGYLFLGHSESLFGVSENFRLVHLPGATAYVKGERSSAGGGKAL